MILRGPAILLAIMLVLLAFPVSGPTETGKLIPVRPAYEDEETKTSDEAAFPAPGPKQQMYVFWILGKMISYPIDKAESFIKGQIEKPFFRPASSPPQGNDPFAALDRGEIPPAPPVAGTARNR